MQLKDMPKLECPFERANVKGVGYVCVPKFRREFQWILDKDKVIATEKFDGTNVSVYIEDGTIKRVLNRTNNVDVWKRKNWFYNGIKRAIDEGKFKLDMLINGQYFGELMGEKINGNPYELDEPLWLPFDYVKKHYYFKFYYDWLSDKFPEKTIIDKYVYEQFSDLFKSLKSLWFRTKGKEIAPEGIVFYNKETGKMCKLRGDMFDWFTGNRHKWKEIEKVKSPLI